MSDLEKQTEYWVTGSDEDWEVAYGLIERGQYRHGLFFIHLSLEKVLKALVCQITQDFPPRIHRLVRLAEIAQICMDSRRRDILAHMNLYQLEGRYPSKVKPPVTKELAHKMVKDCEEVRIWLKGQLSIL